jgi:hypothetical protein
MTRWFLSCALVVGLGIATSTAAQQVPCPTPSSTFDLIQRGIFEQHGCTLDFCHGASKQAGLDLRAGVSYESLLQPDESGNADEPEESDDQDYKLVAPRHPDDSLLWLLLAAKTLQRPSAPAQPMPIGTLPLSRDELEGVRLWIAAGAPEQGIVHRVANLIDACPQASEADTEPLPACDPKDRSLMLPDLAARPPTDIRFELQRGHRLIEFSTTIANTGEGPLIIQAATRPTQPGQLLNAEQVILRTDGSKCAHPAGAIRFSENGRNWEYAQVANFELRKDDPSSGDIVALRTKTYFCLLDSDAIRGTTNPPNQWQAHCTDDIGRMGISAGWEDVYHRVFPGQWLDLDADPETPVAPGTYYLVNVANPSSVLWEMDGSQDSNNLSYTRVAVRMPDPNTPTVQQTPRPGPHASRPPRQRHPAHPMRPAHPVHPSRTAHARVSVQRSGPTHATADAAAVP